MLRIGLGRDLHRLGEGRRFVLGGVEIPSEKGEIGHSDGDVLIHAEIDALLGASGLGDIGSFFPSADSQWKDAPSLRLLGIIWDTLRGEDWSIVNIDCVVSCEKPAVLPHREKIRETLGAALGIGAGRIFLKGKTGEGIGCIGRGEAVEAIAVCLLEKDDKRGRPGDGRNRISHGRPGSGGQPETSGAAKKSFFFRSPGIKR
jgi:2-C-methyl-D-erythritol 2,4-cyclodiphosphate synthase/2-C-methyl-D-erythritol 4-phosphate cytidylyltransferase/2-C-methyl-D-erythritol 2,4-cyclodiphosphate synthase